jgi:hypothetical protein
VIYKEFLFKKNMTIKHNYLLLVKYPFLLILLFVVQVCYDNNADLRIDKPILQEDSTYHFKAKPQNGFNFDYVVYIPKGINTYKITTLLVESNNSGLSDSLEDHLESAKRAAALSSVGNYVSKKLKIPLLVPVIPRTEKRWQVYTHAFDSDTFNEKSTDIERIDLQILKMVQHAKVELNNLGVQIDDRFFMTGFSASGTFANRFSILHPEKLKAVAAGGLNGLLIIPQSTLNNRILNFPIGIADVEAKTGINIDLNSYRKLPQFWFMGENDTNDAVLYDDGYNSTEQSLIYDVLDTQMMPDRWRKSKNIYVLNEIPAIIKTYSNIGHGTDKKINNDISEFFRKYID